MASFPDYPPTIPEFTRLLSARNGEEPLIIRGEDRLSYAGAERRSARLARGLLARGAAKGTRIGLLLPNGPDWLVAWLAVTRIGAIAVPINTFFKRRELAWLLRHADVDTLLTADCFLGHDYLARLEEVAPELAGAHPDPLRLKSLPYLRRVVVWGRSERSWTLDARDLEGEDADAVDADLLSAIEANVSPADPMVILYSSGSTADPKGALHTHGAVIRHSFNLFSLRDLTAADRVWSPMPFFWVGGFMFALMGTMHAGASIYCEDAFDPEKTLALMERERITVATGWPHFGKALADHPTRPARDLSALRSGNVPDILPEEVVPADPALRPNALGMTETCGPHTWGGDGVLPDALRGSFGRGIEGVEHRVVDPESGATLPPGASGEISVRGYSLMQGLYKVERETTFEPDGFYRTGDGGRFDEDGVLYFEGRLGEMIKTGGANVTPSEVEAVLVSQTEVQAAYVVGLANPERGQIVAAAVVLEPGADVSDDELRSRLKREIAAYKVPRHLVLCTKETLPFTDSGKVDKRRLEQSLSARIGAGDGGCGS